MKKTERNPQKTREEKLLAKVGHLEAQLAEAQETLRAIHNGEVDALVIETTTGPQVFTLKTAEQPYRIMVETMSEGAVTIISDGTILYCNRRFADMVRTPLERIIGNSVYRFVGPGEETVFESLIYWASGEDRKKTHLQAADGTILPVLLSMSALDEVAFGSVCLLVADITELQQAQQLLQNAHDELESQVEERTRSLRVSEERYRLALKAANDAVYDLDLTTETVHWNETYITCFGRAPEICKSRQWWIERIYPDDLERVIEELHAATEGPGDHWIGEYRFLRADGTWAHIYDRCFIARDASGKAQRLVGAMLDLTERKQAEDALRNSLLRVEEINKELEAFSYSISHDLRAPLRAIDGYARMILKKHKDSFDEDTLRKFNEIRNGAQLMDKLINDILTLSRLGKANMAIAKLDIAGMLKDLWRDVQIINPDRNMTLTVHSMPPVDGDQTYMKQAFANLLSNAVKFTKNRDEAQIEAGAYMKGNEVVFYVRDNGAGFDMTYREKLFGIFQRLHSDREYEGTGIGLATVKRIASLHRGRVWAEGKENEGATFYISLPVSDDHPK